LENRDDGMNIDVLPEGSASLNEWRDPEDDLVGEEPSIPQDDPGSLAEQERQECREAAEAEELRARAAALAILNQPTDTIPDPDDNQDAPATATSRIENVQLALQYIEEIRAATLDNGGLDEAIIGRLRNPQQGPVDISDPDVRLSLDLFLALGNASEETYKACREAILRRYPDSCLLSLHSVKNLVTDITGVILVPDDMCINSCHAFTGPFAQLQACSICGESRYHPDGIPRQQASTFLLGPQVQASRRSDRSADEVRYAQDKLDATYELLHNLHNEAGESVAYDDLIGSNEMVDLAELIELTRNDTLVGFSIDGAQLYQNKNSDVWIAIWILENLSPDNRFKKRRIWMSTVIPGPNKPKIVDSYLFRALHHLSALQRENNGAGLRVWDESQGCVVNSRIIFTMILGSSR
jgi:hypothetical protein